MAQVGADEVGPNVVHSPLGLRVGEPAREDFDLGPGFAEEGIDSAEEALARLQGGHPHDVPQAERHFGSGICGAPHGRGSSVASRVGVGPWKRRSAVGSAGELGNHRGNR